VHQEETIDTTVPLPDRDTEGKIMLSATRNDFMRKVKISSSLTCDKFSVI